MRYLNVETDDLFLRQTNRGRDEVRRKIDHLEDDEEETLRYKDREDIHYLNEEKGVFNSVFDRNALNRTASIFDAKAIFKTDTADS